MTKAGDRLKAALEDAAKVAQCDHRERIPQPRLSKNSILDRFYCPICKATINEPRPSWRR